MILVQPVQSFSFNYTTYDQNAGLFVAFNIYNVTTGSAVFVSQVDGVLADFGSYVADFIPQANQTYLVIGLVYTSDSYLTVDTTRSPASEVYQSIGSTVTKVGFAYPAYDLATNLNLQASIYSVESGSATFLETASMVHVASGVYYGSFTGILTTSYQIISVVYTDNTFTTPNLNYAPGADEFESISLLTDIYVTGSAQLTYQPHINPPLELTQGDSAILYLLATDEFGNPLSLTGATFSTQINGPNGVVVTFGNSKHTINSDQLNEEGQFTLSLNSSDTNSLGIGNHKEVLTAITIGSNVVSFRGFNILEVYPAIPLQ